MEEYLTFVFLNVFLNSRLIMERSENGTFNKWNRAALCGLMLAMVTIAFSSLSQIKFLSGNGVINTILWIAKTFISVWMLIRFMKSYSAETEHSAFRFGLAVSFFSAFVIAIFNLAAYQWLFPGMQDQVAETFEQFKNMPNIPTESLSAMDSVMANYSHILFFVSFIKDMIVGLVAVAIINSSISQPNDIFKDSEDELQ
mgnify:FL=1